MTQGAVSSGSVTGVGVSAGLPEPLGVTPTATGVNVAVFSTTAQAIELCLFDEAGGETRILLPERTGPVFHGHVEGVKVGARYGLRAHGAFDPARGLRFDASKLLVDPFARAFDGPFELNPAMFSGDALTDSAPFMPKGVVTAEPAPAAPPPVHPWSKTVIYEAHVRGLTRLHAHVPEAIRGTFAALAHPAIIEHLTQLGITTLELLPTCAWIDERHLPPLGLTNYWGYNPVAFCAPDPRLAPGGWAEVRAATQALADAGIETILDVVFNHTGEGDALGPTLSLRGLDNSGYYWLNPDDPARYIDDSGTGNTLRCDTPQGVRLVTEAMRTWVRAGGVAGFRFDLATVLARRATGFDPHAPLLAAIDQDPELRAVKLIAEPWDCGPGGWQVGNFPGHWGEWNDRFRDTVRRFWQGSATSLGELAGRIAGSQDLFGARGRPSRSVNFVTAHDGFTLADLVSFERKQNRANGEQNRDGTDNNSSWNNGVEGFSDDPKVQAARKADQRALLATLILARGTPMLSMGAELGQSQDGNNNAYAQDNATSWLDWEGADPELAAFTAGLIRLRQEVPALTDDRFLTGEARDRAWPDVEWRRLDGQPLEAHDWDNAHGGSLQMVLSGSTGPRVVLIFHRGHDSAPARLPEPRDGHGWRLALCSAEPGREEIAEASVEVRPRSVVALIEEAGRLTARQPDDAMIAELAAAAGVSGEWWGLDGGRHPVSAESHRAILSAMGVATASRDDVLEGLWRLKRPASPPVMVLRQGEPVTLTLQTPQSWLTLELEDGRSQPVRIVDGQANLGALPLGYHRVRLGGEVRHLIMAPARGFELDALRQGARRFGLSAQLYSVSRAGDQGVGDFTTLGDLGEKAAALGAGMVALNPLHTLFPQDRERASPYFPSDRRFLDPIYLDIAALSGAPVMPSMSPAATIDYPAVWTAKSASLEAVTAAISADPSQAGDLARFVAEGGPALQDFCIFQALSEAHGGGWRNWPAGLRDPASLETQAFAKANAPRVRHHQILQWLCERQLAAAAARAPNLGLCRDLAVGAAPDGAEAWSAAGRLAMTMSIGAPPDAFAPQGQVWGLPPPVPARWQAEGYASFRDLVRANMRHAGALRVDHVLGLSRLFWVPEGAQGSEGAYVAYPASDLLGVLALESHRAECLVIGEDLGTVPDGLREALRDHAVYSYKVLPFERDGEAYRPASAYERQAVACVSTHDLPTLVGWWQGADIEERGRLGLIAPDGLAAARKARKAEIAALLQALDEAGLVEDATPPEALTSQLAAAIHAFVASAPSQLMLVQLEDLFGETVGVNLPGTDRERPNWRRRLTGSLDDLGASELSQAILAAVRAARAEPAP